MDEKKYGPAMQHVPDWQRADRNPHITPANSIIGETFDQELRRWWTDFKWSIKGCPAKLRKLTQQIRRLVIKWQNED